MCHVCTAGKTQSFISFTVFGSCRGDLVFVVDSSGSIRPKNWFIVKQFIMDTIRGLKINADQTRVGVIVYSHYVVGVFHLQQYYDVDVITNIVWEIPYIASVTNTAGGIKVYVIASSTNRCFAILCITYAHVMSIGEKTSMDLHYSK